MIRIPLWKTLLTVGICFLGIIFISPNFFSRDQLASFPSWFPKNKIVLGLDLQGGAHLLLEVDFNAVLEEQMHSLSDATRSTLRKEHIGYTGLTAKNNFVTFTLRNPADLEKAKALLQQNNRDIEISSTAEGQLTLTLNETAINERKKICPCSVH
jgi:preprotein translocase subunit SecD